MLLRSLFVAGSVAASLLAGCASSPDSPANAGAGGAGVAGGAGAQAGGGAAAFSGAGGTASGGGGTAGAGEVAGGAGTGGRAAGGTGGASGGAGNAGLGGSAGSGGATGGVGGSGGAGDSGNGGIGQDTVASRPINTDNKGFRENTFSAQSLDPMATQGHAGDTQYAAVNTSKPLQKKLCIVLTDKGVKPGIATADWMYDHGFHVLQLGYQNDLAMAPDADTNPDTPGDTRMDQFDGKGRVKWVSIKRADSLEERTVRALKYLVTKDAGGDWGWFLSDDQTGVRWSDGCLIGNGYSGTFAAVVSRYVRLGLVVSTSAPEAEGHPSASWLKKAAATPAERVFAIYGQNDTPAAPGRYDDTTAALGYLGDIAHVGLTDAPAVQNPYGGSHRLEINGSGKSIFCAAGADYPPCLYSFGLPLQ